MIEMMNPFCWMRAGQNLWLGVANPRINNEKNPGQLEENKLLIRKFFQLIDSRDAEAIRRLVAINYIDHNPQFPNLGQGREGLLQGIAIANKAWSNFYHEIKTQIAEGDKVVSFVRASGLHVGEFLGVPPTGKRIHMSGIAMHRIARGKLAEHWSKIDQVSVLHQLGAFKPDHHG